MSDPFAVLLAILITIGLLVILGISIAIRTAIAYDDENDEAQDNG